MKKLAILILISVIGHFITDAQNLTFTFIPKDESNNIDSIRAEDISTGESYISRGSNEISFTITSVNINSISDDITVYPNPSHGQTQLQFYSKVDDEINITLVNTSGQVLASNQKKIVQGFHIFKITSSNKGVCIINVIGNKSRFSQKVVITDTSDDNSIEYIGVKLQEHKEKSANEDELKVLHFFVYSGDKITKIADTPTESKTYEVEFYECKDADGRNYPIIQIGEQWWMAENLATTKYNDSTAIPLVTGNSAWQALSTPAYCWYNNDETTYKYDYGALYNWYVVDTASNGSKNVCPAGWHVPTDEEWKQLEIYLGMSQTDADTFGERGTIEGGKLKESGTLHWNSPNTAANNETGFTALPGGLRTNYCLGMSNFGIWWSSTEATSSSVWTRSVIENSGKVRRNEDLKELGISVRCVKD